MNGKLVNQYGRLWARNQKNINHLQSLDNPIGVYILCDGSMPVYIGQGNIKNRIERHNQSKHKKTYWDHFTWFTIAQQKFVDDLEALIIRMLPFYLRSLNRQRPKFTNKDARMEEADKHVVPPREFPQFAPKKYKRLKKR